MDTAYTQRNSVSGVLKFQGGEGRIRKNNAYKDSLGDDNEKGRRNTGLPRVVDYPS